MPSAKNSKRTTDSQAKSSTSKRAKVKMTQVDKKFNTVMGALTNEETVVPGPDSNRAMLVAVAKAALKVPKDERHTSQDAVLGMLMEIFNAERDRWEARVSDASRVLEKATVERTEKIGLKDAAEADLKSQNDEVGARMEALSETREVVKESKEELSRAFTLHGDANAAKNRLVKTQGHYLAMQETINGLKEGMYENPTELKKRVKSVSELFDGLGAEEGLVKTLPQILRSKPSERGNFDELALQQLDLYLNNHINSLNSNIEAADAIVSEHVAATTAWEAAIEFAEDKRRESEEALQAAEAQQEQMQNILTCARKAQKESAFVVKSRGSDLAKEQWGLQNIEEVREALEFLLEYVAPVSEEKEAQEPEQVATEPTETCTEIPAEMPVNDLGKKWASSEESIIPTFKAKDIDMHMNLEDVPSPSKKARHSLGASTPNVVA